MAKFLVDAPRRRVLPAMQALGFEVVREAEHRASAAARILLREGDAEFVAGPACHVMLRAS